MSYNITVCIYQTNPNAFFKIVEKTCFHYANGCTWSEVNDQHVLAMGGSGTSGALRFQCDETGERFIVTLGVHNYKRWGDIVSNLSTSETGLLIQPQYYSGDHKDREQAREKQLASYSVKNAKGRQLAFNYTTTEGSNLKCDIVIG
jgi:hypothetical protein